MPIDNSLKLALGEIMTSSNMGYELHQLCDVFGFRSSGSETESIAKDYLVGRFKGYGITKVAAEWFTISH